MKIIGLVLGTCIPLPIQIYLSYQIMWRVDATELMWFLWWVQIPVTLLVQVLLRLGEHRV